MEPLADRAHKIKHKEEQEASKDKHDLVKAVEDLFIEWRSKTAAELGISEEEVEGIVKGEYEC